MNERISKRMSGEANSPVLSASTLYTFGSPWSPLAGSVMTTWGKVASGSGRTILLGNVAARPAANTAEVAMEEGLAVGVLEGVGSRTRRLSANGGKRENDTKSSARLLHQNKN